MDMHNEKKKRPFEISLMRIGPFWRVAVSSSLVIRIVKYIFCFTGM